MIKTKATLFASQKQRVSEENVEWNDSVIIGLTEIDKMESIVKSEHLVELMKDNEIAILEMLIIYGFAFCKNINVLPVETKQ